MDYFKKLEQLFINTRSKHFAIKDIKAKGWTPSRIREILTDLSGKPAAHIEDIEAEKTLMYLVAQILDPMADIDLDNAHFSTLELFEKYPYLRAEEDDDLDADGNLREVKYNEDGVRIGKDGKPRKGYKKEMALELWRTNPNDLKRGGDDRKGWVDLFVEQISDMGRSVANTYVLNLESGKWA